MSRTHPAEIHVEAEQGDEAPQLLKAALFCALAGAAVLGVGFAWLGSDGMLNPKSPSFFPLWHLFGFAGLALAGFFAVRSWIHGRRYRIFGTSVLDANAPALGEPLIGTLRIARPQALTAPITLALRCDWRHQASSTSGVTQNRTTTQTLWETSVQVDGSAGSAGIPFQLDLPADGLPSGRRPKPKTGVHPESPGVILWTLRASSRRPGTDYLAEFEVEVKPGRVIAQLASQAGAQAASRHHAVEEILSPHAANAVSAVAELLGGHMPSAAELDSEAEATARPEPAQPFASSPWKGQSGVLLLRRAAFIALVLFGALALFLLSRQLLFGGDGAVVPATIAAVERNLVTLDLGAGDHAHPISVSTFHRWQVGERVEVLCVPGEGGKRRCRMVSGFDRWLDGLFALGLTLVAGGVRSYLGRRRAAGGAAAPRL